MMKKLLLSSLLLVSVLSQSVFAYESFITVSCALPELENVHRFQAFGVFKLEEDQKLSGTITLQLIKGSEVRSVMQFDQIAVTGRIESYDVSDLNSVAYQVITLATDIPYLQFIELSFKEQPLASKVQSIDNFSYRSDCKFYF